MKRSEINIVFLALSRIESQYSSPAYSLAKEFAKQNKVYYVNHPYTLKDYLNERKHNKLVQRIKGRLLTQKTTFEETSSPNLISIVPPITWPINFIPNSFLYRLFQNWNNKIVLKSIKKALKRYNIDNYIYINCYDPFYLGTLPSSSNALLNIYQSMDDISQDPYTAKHGVHLENESVKNSDFSIVTSFQLQEKLKRYNEKTFIVNNAVDIEIFEQAVQETLPTPQDIQHISGKIIGYTGNLDELRVDFELIKKIAEKHTDKTVLLVGPINADSFYSNGLDKMDNVITVGSKDITELPSYLQKMDVVLIPFKLNTLTASIYPLKVNEYLATGKSVLSTNFSRDINLFSEVINIVDSHDDFVEAIDVSIDKNTPEDIQTRIATANKNTWEARVDEIWQLVETEIDLS